MGVHVIESVNGWNSKLQKPNMKVNWLKYNPEIQPLKNLCLEIMDFKT